MCYKRCVYTGIPNAVNRDTAITCFEEKNMYITVRQLYLTEDDSQINQQPTIFKMYSLINTVK